MATPLPRYVNIKDHTTLVRDTFSKGVLNTNTQELHDAKLRKKIALERLANERRREMELNTLRGEVAELRELVLKLVGKNA